MAQLLPLPLTVSCFSEIQIGFIFLVPAHLGSHGKRAVKRVYVYVCMCVLNLMLQAFATAHIVCHIGQTTMFLCLPVVIGVL